ncbi:MAG: aminodeoxychorismate/anthranilate synthase component II [Deltaproteobacteria bacterium]|nr:aminodeoxychorismate/anthranilate synthase component II [Deltaproteobacteria bacterium]
MRVVLVDNFDSFTFNLVDLFARAAGQLQLGLDLQVRRPDTTSAAAIERDGFDAAILSPGPGAPEEAQLCLDLLRIWRGRKPVFGVCLGHQAIAVALGARVVRSDKPIHGKVFAVHHRGQGCLAGLPQPLPAMRYHSLSVARADLPSGVEVTAALADGTVMALRGDGFEGVQFHPESIGTPDGLQLALNVLRGWRERPRAR